MLSQKGFWSYVHADNEAEGQRISRLARDVEKQFEMLTGELLEVFLDRDAIKWGEDWRERIDSSLASVAFFIPVLTPRYFMSPECRREFQFFARRAVQLGIRDLILPLLYVDVPGLQAESPSDEIMLLVQSFQWEDWRELRFADLTAEGYRRGVARLASRLVEANRRMEKADIVVGADQLSRGASQMDEEAPGFLDHMAATEEAMPKLVEVMKAISDDVEAVGQVMQEATAELNQSDRSGKHAAAARLLIARKVARRLSEPAERIWGSANAFVSHLHEANQGICAIIERAPDEVATNLDAKSDVCEFFNAIRTLSESANVGLGSAQGMIDAIRPIEGMSRDLRPILRRLRQGLTVMVEATEVSDEWVKLIDVSPVRCEDPKIGSGGYRPSNPSNSSAAELPAQSAG